MALTLATLLLALDFGGTKLSYPGQQTWLAQRRSFSPPGSDGRYEYDTMLDLVYDLVEQIGQPVAAIGVSFGGPVYAPGGLVRRSFHTPGWENTPLADWLQAEFNAPAVIDNDANAAALGEFRFGVGQGCRHLLYVTVSTGVGGGWIIDGQPYAGAITLMNPDRIILGGGVTKSSPLWWQTVLDVTRALTPLQINVEITLAALGDDAPLWGAIAWAEKLLGSS